MKILLTGEPKVGKSSILKEVVNAIPHSQLMGCLVTQNTCKEIRTSFDITYLPTQEKYLLASKKNLYPHNLGNYFVNIDHIIAKMIPFMNKMSGAKNNTLLIFDEIGRMQNMAPGFTNALDSLFKTNNFLIATIVFDDEPWAKKYKKRKDIFLINVTIKNRDYLSKIILKMIQNSEQLSKTSKKYIPSIINLFQHFLINNRYLEVSKLLSHTLYYLEKEKIVFCTERRRYTVHGFHGNKTISFDDDGYLKCTCDFFLSQKGMCSHLQSIFILNNGTTINHLQLLDKLRSKFSLHEG